MGVRKSIVVVGSGISGLSAAWLLSQRHDVTVYEAEGRAGGHSNTIDVSVDGARIPVDTGFIVYNTASYPNLIALFDHLGVATAPTSMSFAVSFGAGRYEYAGSSLASLIGQPANLARPAHWRLIADLFRFFREAPGLIAAATDERLTLGAWLAQAGYSNAFIQHHILPMAAAIWSTPSRDVLSFPVAAFVRFFSNHGLLQVRDRPEWRTVVGGSRAYVHRLSAAIRGDIRLGEAVIRVRHAAAGISVSTATGERSFDACVLACHANDALNLLAEPGTDQRRLLSAFRYSRNRAVLHRDARLMPRRRRLWSSWNYIGPGEGADEPLCVTYWMNRLQPLGDDCPDLFVTLNPGRDIAPASVEAAFDYAHPIFDSDAMAAQRRLWRLQGQGNIWFCGSYFGYGFHEDGLQAGLAVAEQLGDVRRPWAVADESGRVHLAPVEVASPRAVEAAE